MNHIVVVISTGNKNNGSEAWSRQVEILKIKRRINTLHVHKIKNYDKVNSCGTHLLIRILVGYIQRQIGHEQI